MGCRGKRLGLGSGLHMSFNVPTTFFFMPLSDYGIGEFLIVGWLTKNTPALDSTGYNVVKGIGIIHSDCAYHTIILTVAVPLSNCK